MALDSILGQRMPVEFDTYRESLEEGNFDRRLREGSNAFAILSFLAEHPEQGFTVEEIHDGTGIQRESTGKTLHHLKERQLVRHVEPYWAFGHDDRVGTYLGMLSSLEAISEREGTEDLTEWRDSSTEG